MTSFCSTAETLVRVCDTAIDWGATGDLFSGIGTTLGAVAVIVTATKAADTFKQWKAQTLGGRKIEQAERILTATYEAKDALEYARGVMTWAHELDKAREEVSKLARWSASTKNEQDRLIHAQARINRLNTISDKQKPLVECMPMGKALFGDELHKALTDFHHQFWVLQTYIEAYVDDERGTDANFSKRIRDAIFGGRSEDNEISAVVKTSIKTIENHCLPVLRHEDEAPKERWCDKLKFKRKEKAEAEAKP